MTLLLAVAMLAPPAAVRIESIRAPFPPHCLAHDQWRDPVANSPVDLFDSTRWWKLCARAAHEKDYALDVRFAEAVRIDRLRLSRPPGRSANHVEVQFHDRTLSTAVPVYFRQVPIGPEGGEARLTGPLKWNPNLLDDDAFRARRVAAGLDPYEMPTPMRVDGLTFVVRGLEKGDGPPSLGPVSLWLGDTMLPLQGGAAARKAHATWVGEGIQRVLRGKHLIATERVLSFDPSGVVHLTSRDAWNAGNHHETRTVLGRWRVADGRLEFATTGPYAPVEYTLDDAPQEVWLQTAPLRGVYRLVGTAPANTEAPPLLESPPDAPAPPQPVPVIPVR